MVEAIQYFFRTGVMYPAISITAITLIPKVQTPTHVKDYRLIACRSIVYKIISKVVL